MEKNIRVSCTGVKPYIRHQSSLNCGMLHVDIQSKERCITNSEELKNHIVLTLKATSHGNSTSAKMQAYISGGCNEAAWSCCNQQCIQKTAELVSATVVANPADCAQHIKTIKPYMSATRQHTCAACVSLAGILHIICRAHKALHRVVCVPGRFVCCSGGTFDLWQQSIHHIALHISQSIVH